MKVLIFDSNSIINRAFYGIKLLTTKDGIFTNAVYGFVNMTLKIIDEVKPDCVLFAFDLKAKTFRHKMYDGYKGQRKGMPDELAQQVPIVKDIIGYMGYTVLTKEGYEADDILGTVAAENAKRGGTTVIATGDRDSLQLVSDHTTVYLATNTKYEVMTPEAVMAKYEVEPKALIETKALMGDASDNIPGVAGVGEKTAFSLIKEFGTVENVYNNLDSDKIKPAVKKKLEAGKDMADLSRKLGEIYCEVPLEEFDELVKDSHKSDDELYKLLSKLELHTIIERLGLTGTAAEEETAEPAEIFTEGSLEDILKADKIYIGMKAENEDVISLAVMAEGRYFETSDSEEIEKILLSDAEKYVTDSKPLHRFMISRKKEANNIVFDLRLSGYVLSPNSTEYTVERLAAEYGVQRGTTEKEASSAVNDAVSLKPLAEKLTEKLTENGEIKLYNEIELPLARVLASMELYGFMLDSDGLKAFGEEIKGLADGLEKEIYELAGHEFNINSPKQLSVVLFEELELPTGKKTKSGYSTGAEVLESLVPYHPIINKILEYRKYTKLISTYVEGLLKVVADDGRIHTRFNQTETRTGRISSLEPNMQNIPIRTEPGSRMRSFFVAKPGYTLIDADYSQIELRVLASLANDENMIDAFISGEDIHRNTAAQVFGLPPLFVTNEMRSKAKAVNFGIVYGISAFSLSKDIGVTVKEADKYIKDYLKHYSGVKNYMEHCTETAKENGFAETYFGRRRYIPELSSSNRNLRNFGERVAMNMPIQGTAADIIKIAMIEVDKKLSEAGLDAHLILQVHDELIVEAKDSDAEKALAIVKGTMESAVKMAVPMIADANTGASWGEAH